VVFSAVNSPEPSEHERAIARSRAYRLFSEAFEYPDDERPQRVRDGAFSRPLEEALALVAPELGEGLEHAALCDGGQDDELAIDYTRLFDVGASGPPCPLYGGLYGGARMKTMEEAIRFYNHFGLKLSERPRELPDHIGTQLEFLHYLAFREAEALEGEGDPAPYQRAQRDFVERHPGHWVPMLRERVEKEEPMAFFREIVRQLDRFLAHELNERRAT
jgi:DMSO reductase family type II enzyme chaperone